MPARVQYHAVSLDTHPRSYFLNFEYLSGVKNDV